MKKDKPDINTRLLSSLDVLQSKTHKDLVHYHSIHKYLFMTYDALNLKKLGRIVANKDRLPYEEVFISYKQELEKMLQKEPTRSNQINTYEHIYGYFKNILTKEEKNQFFERLLEFKESNISQKEVLGLLREYIDRFDEPYLKTQTIFDMDD